MQSFAMVRLRSTYAPVLALFAALGAWRAIGSPDAFWHLAAGRWILEHGSIPRHDPFRFTSGGEAWVDHEWGFQLLLALAENVGGSAGLLAFRSAVFALLAWLLWRLATTTLGTREPGIAALLGFALLVTIDGLQARMPLRPELLTLVCFSTLLWLLEAARVRPQITWLAVPLTAAWINVHPGALVAPGIVFLHRLGQRLQRTASPNVGGGEVLSWTQVLAPSAAAALALGLNPWGFHVVALPIRIRAALADLPATNPDWRRLWHDPPYLLMGVLLLLAILAIRVQGRKIDLPSSLVLAASAGLMVLAVRFQGLVWIAALLFAAQMLRHGRGAVAAAGRRWAPLVLALLALGCGVEGWRAVQATVGVQADRFPESGVSALENWHRTSGVGHLFNSAVFGGYVVYRSFPPRQIFVDTRNEVDPSILRQLAEARSDARAWRALVERYDLDAALVRYEDRPRQVVGPPATPGGQPTAELRTTSALLFPQTHWALVHWDDVSMLFLRRIETRAPALEDSEYRFVQPEDVRATLQRAAADPAFRGGLLADLRRKLDADPECRRAQALLEAVSR